jgi:hypothetical protein
MTNAFIGFLEKVESPQTVYCVDHPSIYERADVAQIETKPLFLQHVHERNVYNYVRGEVSSRSGALDDFNLKL